MPLMELVMSELPQTMRLLNESQDGKNVSCIYWWIDENVDVSLFGGTGEHRLVPRVMNSRIHVTVSLPVCVRERERNWIWWCNCVLRSKERVVICPELGSSDCYASTQTRHNIPAIGCTKLRVESQRMRLSWISIGRTEVMPLGRCVCFVER
jgi:hypothetical protein